MPTRPGRRGARGGACDIGTVGPRFRAVPSASGAGHVVHQRIHHREWPASGHPRLAPGGPLPRCRPAARLTDGSAPCRGQARRACGLSHLVQQRRPVALRHVQLQPGPAPGGHRGSSLRPYPARRCAHVAERSRARNRARDRPGSWAGPQLVHLFCAARVLSSSFSCPASGLCPAEVGLCRVSAAARVVVRGRTARRGTPVSAAFADGTGHGKLTTMNMRGSLRLRYERSSSPSGFLARRSSARPRTRDAGRVVILQPGPGIRSTRRTAHRHGLAVGIVGRLGHHCR